MVLSLPSNRERLSRATSKPRRHSSQSVAASSSPRVQPQSLSSLHLKRLPAAESLATGAASFSAGKAKNNQTEQQIEGGPRTKHGGADDADNSGTLSYVRIEFAGYPFQKDKEINGLTLGSVGSGTEIDHVQVSYSNDDSFEWFGGTVNCKYLVAYKGWDDVSIQITVSQERCSMVFLCATAR